MCQFKSAIVTRTGELYHSPYTDSHEDIIDANNLKDSTGNLVRIEYVPMGTYWELDKYKFKVDEKAPPKWFQEYEKKTERKMKSIIKKMLITGKRKVLIGGAYIIKDANIGEVAYCRIMVISNAKIQYVGGNAKIQYVGGNATIQYVGGNATIQNVMDNAKIQYVGGNATIQYVGGNATIQYVGGNATIQNVRGNARIIHDYR